MTRVSKKKLSPNVARKITNTLVSSVAEARTRKDAAAIIQELLSDAEQLMLAKRLAIIVLLTRGYSYEQITELLNVSSSTITLIWRDYKNGNYSKIVARALSKKQSNKDPLMCMVDDFIKIMPPYVGKGRYSALK